jgi:hypothetical protein
VSLDKNHDTYKHLDFIVVNFKAHTLNQWETIHVDLAKVFYYDPTVKVKMVGAYVKGTSIIY